MAENYNAPLLSSDQGSDSYQPVSPQANHPAQQAINQAPQYAQPQYGHPMNQPVDQAQYGQPQYGQPQYGQPMNQPQYGQPQYGQPMNQAAYAQPVQQGYAPSNQPMNQPLNQVAQPMYGGAPVAVLAVPNPGEPGHIQTFGTWSDGLFDCFNAPTICVLSMFVPCYRWPTTIARLGFLSFAIALALYGGAMLAAYICSGVNQALYPEYFDLNGSNKSAPTASYLLSLAASVAGVITIGLGAHYRTKIRARYAIVGSPFSDVCTYIWCSCCAMAQEARHVDRDYGLMV